MATSGVKYFLIFAINFALNFKASEQSLLGYPKDIANFIPQDLNNLNIVKDFLESYKDAPSLIEEIALLEKDDGLQKFKLGYGNEDKDLNITQLIKKYGYKVEEHTVTTDDGYILTMYRIPGDGPPAFVMHGALSSSDDYFTIGPDKALPYLLSKAGYDVWLGNARGNHHCRKHVRLSPEKDEALFFDFSWHEIGLYDLPAMIDYILDHTGEKSVYYVGHSQGTMSFFVMCSERPEYNKKIKLMVSLSTVVYMSHLISPSARLLAPLAPTIEIVTTSLGPNELRIRNPLVDTLADYICGNSVLAQLICSNILFLGSGFDYGQFNATVAPVIFSHSVSSISIKQFYHYAQEINSGKFRQYDYGAQKNLEKYGTEEPPEYQLENVNAPVAIFYSKYNDWISAYEDVQKLIERTPNIVESYEVPWDKFCHTDYLWANDVVTLVYKKILELFEKFNN